MKLNAAALLSKGWESKEIAHASRIIDAAESKKHAPIVILDHLLYWILLTVALVGNVCVAAFLLPVVAFLPGVVTYVVIAIMGASFGSLFTAIMRDIELATRKHHIVAAILLPLSGIITFLTMVDIANADGLTAVRNSGVGISLTYIGFFLIPYLLFLTEEKTEMFEPGAREA